MIEAFNRVLQQMTTILADNAGFDSSNIVLKLQMAHYDGQRDASLNMNEWMIVLMRMLGITESYKLKWQVVLSMSKTTEMIL
ncbi:uncharacterized protein LAESUDRAFT_765455 [Laetiporus sulphureus 93-53]|uniref:Uncharacterized protein n=1 Tax=Laetiporus sulphureus 93-53 TaxID=1314785 RepID=A0A165AR81_9APHY|nr:uncharacterized protein LAESUDRAFT_765455 [Laetiporus sulphureus 93-53]KZS99504.1 hypothetical protein LAESUDRAFT_765455 [Laetiporus sulphureus 93-53]